MATNLLVKVGLNIGDRRWEPGDTIPVGTLTPEAEANALELGLLALPAEPAADPDVPAASAVPPAAKKRKAAPNAR